MVKRMSGRFAREHADANRRSADVSPLAAATWPLLDHGIHDVR
jgi:hypothetical protein